jgi:hypothetical protein
MAQRRRLKTNFQALPNGQDMIAAPLLPPGHVAERNYCSPLLFEHQKYPSFAGESGGLQIVDWKEREKMQTIRLQLCLRFSM